MKKYFDYYEHEPLMVDRESLHKGIRTMLAEENLPECQRAYLQLIEDLHNSLASIYVLYNRMKEKELLISKEELADMENIAKKNEKTLEVWERHLLRSSFCSGESCF